MTTGVDELRALIQKQSAPRKYAMSRRGHDWFQLSEAEEEVFEIKLSEMPLLMTVWEAYEAVADVTDNSFDADVIERVQNELDWITPRSLESLQFQRFAALFGVSNRKAHAIYTKVDFHAARNGLVTYKDEKESA